METKNYTREQKVDLLKDACQLIRYMANNVHNQYELIPRFADKISGSVLDVMLKQASDTMNTMGDLLNAMDAVPEENEWSDQVFLRMRSYMNDGTDPVL